MKKNIFSLFLALILFITPVFATNIRHSEDYLKNNKHCSIMNPFVEHIVESTIKRQLKKETGAKFDVKFEGYTLSSMKEGIFKYLEISVKDKEVDEIYVPYADLKTLTDYNWVAYNQDPIKFKSDMTYAFEAQLSEKTLNDALSKEEYQTIIRKLNKLAYPLFSVKNVTTKIKDNKVHICLEYNFPIAPTTNNKLFNISTNFKVQNGNIVATDVKVEKTYSKIPITKIINLINLINPLSYTINIVDGKQCKVKVDTFKIENNLIFVNGKIYIKGE